MLVSVADAWNGVCPEVMCAMYCEYGFTKDMNGCDLCICYNPCDVSKININIQYRKISFFLRFGAVLAGY